MVSGRLTIMLGVLLCSCVAEVQDKPVGQQPTEISAFVNVNVIPMDSERILENQTVLIHDDRIHEIGPVAKVRVPDSAMVIDAEGSYLIPGLADMHAHIEDEDFLLLFIANGVTTVRNMWGEPKHLEWRSLIAEGELTGPTIYTAGPIIDGDPPVFPGSAVITTPEQAQETAQEQKAAGYDFLKVYNNPTLEVYDALILAAKNEGIPVAGHVPSRVGLDHVLASQQRCIEHLDGYEIPLAADEYAIPEGHGWASLLMPWLEVDSQKIPKLVRKTREANVWNCPTLVVLQKYLPADTTNLLLQGDEFKYLSPAELEYHNPETSYLSGFTPELFEAAAGGDSARKMFTKALHDDGARILLGTDCGNPLVVYGFSIHEELQNFVDAGLTPYDALKTGTHDAAEFFDALDEFGTVTVGRRADLILLDANPLEDVVNVKRRVGVMVRGRWFPESELQSRLNAIADKRVRLKAEASADTPDATGE